MELRLSLGAAHRVPYSDMDTGQLGLDTGAGTRLFGLVLRLAERTDHVASVRDVGHPAGGRLVVASQTVLSDDHDAAEYHDTDADHRDREQGAVPGALPEAFARHYPWRLGVDERLRTRPGRQLPTNPTERTSVVVVVVVVVRRANAFVIILVVAIGVGSFRSSTSDSVAFRNDFIQLTAYVASQCIDLPVYSLSIHIS